MNDSPEHEDPIDEVASDWLTLRAEGFSSTQKRDFERWCRADPRHAATVARLEAACALLEKMPLVRAELQPVLAFPTPARAAQRASAPKKIVSGLRLAIGLAAAVALAFFVGRQLPFRPPSTAQIFATSAGGYEHVVLADGSVVELNADTQVRVTLVPRERRIELTAGEAHFTVAHDHTRPFIVSAGGVAVRAVGTAFNVRLAPTAVEVLVTEGKVSVSDVGPALVAVPSLDELTTQTGSPASASPTFLSANERTVISRHSLANATAAPPPEPIVEKIATATVREALSWQERKLVFSETPLSEVVTQFNRRNRVQLVLADAALAERPVGGTFAADNVEGVVRLLEGSGTITVERRDELTVVLRATR